MKYISLEFSEDLHRHEVDSFKTVRHCTGVSAYRNTLNMYFKTIDRTTLLSLAQALHRHLSYIGTDVSLKDATFDSSVSTAFIYQTLRAEVES
jgi:hypothetical protein